MKKKRTILITDTSHPVTAGTLEALDNDEHEYVVVGVDHSESLHQHGKIWVDHHYQVPHPQSHQYIESLIEICKKHEVDLLIPWTDEEVLSISKELTTFSDNGIQVLSSSYESVKKVIDKAILLSNLGQNGLEVPAYTIVNNIKDVESAASLLGYPERRIVIKPRNLSGSRGLCILDPIPQLSFLGFDNKLTLSAFLELLHALPEDRKNTLDYIAMEYLSGDDYSTDVLANHGETLIAIPRLRIKSSSGVSQIGHVVENKEVKKVVCSVVKAFDLHLNVNIQMRFTKDGGTPIVYDVNPRISGSIAANEGTNVSLLKYGIQLAIDGKLPPTGLKYESVLMVRRWKEDYIRSGVFLNANPNVD